ncbi:WD40 repeat-like protein [Rhodotorula sp. JG-1b]|nr:WD40 repeat-like protein [Rhodotorula sp. JG-1b]
MAGQKRSLPFDLALPDPLGPPGTRRRVLDRSVWDSFISTSSYPSRQHALEAHYSCVNALAISPPAADGARWLASGGDDKRVLLWGTALDSETTTASAEPVASYTGASSNLFTIAFTCDGKEILSGGNDSVVLAHDLEYASATQSSSHRDGGIRPTQVWLDHESAVNSISPHPFNPALFISASSDGTLRQFDQRSHDSGGAVAVIADRCGMNHVQHHPLTPEVFVYAGERGNLALIDGRTGWRSSAGDDLEGFNVASRVAVHRQFHTRLTRGFGPAQRYAYPTVSSFTFDRTGSILCATISGYLPTLYELSASEPLACFASPAPAAGVADGESDAPKRASTSAPPDAGSHLLSFPRGYRNTTTTKHGSFGGGADATPGRGLYYAAGSDDFKAYVWEVPNLERLREGRRKRVAASATYGPTADATYPTLVSPASSVLTGHRSVVNTALFHPTLPLLYTAGVEKIIVQHGAAATSSHPGRWRFVPREPKPHFSHPGLDGPSDPADDPHCLPGETPQAREQRLRQEDPQVLQYFDGLEYAAHLGRLREMLEAQGPLGSTRRVLNLIDQLDAAAQGRDLNGGELGSAEEDEGEADEEENAVDGGDSED